MAPFITMLVNSPIVRHIVTYAAKKAFDYAVDRLNDVDAERVTNHALDKLAESPRTKIQKNEAEALKAKCAPHT